MVLRRRVIATPSIRKKNGGAAYLALLIVTALVSFGLVGYSQVFSTTLRANTDEHREWIAAAIGDAIRSYYYSTPGGKPELPDSIEDLLEDGRLLVVRRHLRKQYSDPMGGDMSWQWGESPRTGSLELRLSTKDQPELRWRIALDQ